MKQRDNITSVPTKCVMHERSCWVVDNIFTFYVGIVCKYFMHISNTPFS